MSTLSTDEKKWRAENDARVLADANEIVSDSKRKKAAVQAAKKLAADAEKQANKMKNVSKVKAPKKKGKN